MLSKNYLTLNYTMVLQLHLHSAPLSGPLSGHSLDRALLVAGHPSRYIPWNSLPPTSLVVSSGVLLEQLPPGLPAHSPWLNVPSSHLVTNYLHTHTRSPPHNLTPHQQVLGSQNSFLTSILFHTQYLLISPS